MPVRARLRTDESIGNLFHGDCVPIEGASFPASLSHGKYKTRVGILFVGKLCLDGIDRRGPRDQRVADEYSRTQSASIITSF